MSRDDGQIDAVHTQRLQRTIEELRKELADCRARLARRVPANWKATVMATVIAQVATVKVRSIAHAHEIVFAVVDEQGLLDRRLDADEVRPLLVNIANNVAQILLPFADEEPTT